MFESGSLRIDVKDIMMRAGSRYRGIYNMILTIQNHVPEKTAILEVFRVVSSLSLAP